jgi:hypothetical protein
VLGVGVGVRTGAATGATTGGATTGTGAPTGTGAGGETGATAGAVARLSIIERVNLCPKILSGLDSLVLDDIVVVVTFAAVTVMANF